MKANELDIELEALVGAKEEAKKVTLKISVDEDAHKTIKEIAANNHLTTGEAALLLLLNGLKRYEMLESRGREKADP